MSAQIDAVNNNLRKSTDFLSMSFRDGGTETEDDDEPGIAGSADDASFKRVEKRISDMWSGGQWAGVEYKVFTQLVMREDPDFTGHISAGKMLLQFKACAHCQGPGDGKRVTAYTDCVYHIAFPYHMYSNSVQNAHCADYFQNTLMVEILNYLSQEETNLLGLHFMSQEEPDMIYYPAFFR